MEEKPDIIEYMLKSEDPLTRIIAARIKKRAEGGEAEEAKE